MALIDLLHTGISIADNITRSGKLQTTVKYERSTTDAWGTITLAAPVDLLATVDWRRSVVRTKAGELTASRVIIQFLDIPAVLAATENKGFDDQDVFTLPDGTTGPILDISGFFDPTTKMPVSPEVILG